MHNIRKSDFPRPTSSWLFVSVSRHQNIFHNVIIMNSCNSRYFAVSYTFLDFFGRPVRWCVYTHRRCKVEGGGERCDGNMKLIYENLGNPTRAAYGTFFDVTTSFESLIGICSQKEKLKLDYTLW